MDTSAARHSAYAEFLAGLMDLNDDVATGRFDALIESLVADGTIPAHVATQVRYWQRESLRAHRDYLVTATAASLTALDAARHDAERAVAAADQIWSSVTSASEEPAAEAPLTAPASANSSRTNVERPGSAPPAAPASGDPAAPAAVRGRHRAPSHAAPPGAEPPNGLPAEQLMPHVATTEGDPVTAAPLGDDVVSSAASAPIPDTSPARRRRRLLVAGLTVVQSTDDPAGTSGGGQPAVGG